MTDRFLPIGDYAAIGCTRSLALVSSHGSIDWLCWPRFDSPAIFARILDDQRGGFFAIHPKGQYEVRRRYLESTNVLETTFESGTGVVRLLDLMPVMREGAKRHHLIPMRQLLRRVEGVAGEVEMEVYFCPRPDWGQEENLDRRGENIRCVRTPMVLHLRSDVDFELHGPDAVARFTVSQGGRHDFALAYDTHGPAIMPQIGDEASAEIDRTVRFWREWVRQCIYDGPDRDMVTRSVLALKLMTYAPSGAIVAAPTTSLPERIGGIRNWDYRYCWLRDASFTVAAMEDCGFNDEAGAFVDWILYATQLTHPNLQIMYDVFGEPKLPEKHLDQFAGYEDSRPVRIGNGAASQFQLDVYGEVLGAVEEHLQREKKRSINRDVRNLLVRLANRVVEKWEEPDAGIWEKRSGNRQHVHAKVMAWLALDCMEHLVRGGYAPDTHLDRWHRTKEKIHDTVLRRGYNDEIGSFVSVFDGDQLDASLLYISRVGFLPPDDPRMLGTIAAIRKRLGRDELLYRYELGTEDGLPPGEGAFLACSFWLVEALALAGQKDEARGIFEKLLARSNDVGLYSEEIDVESGALLGNFPQALTHFALVNAALVLSHSHSGRSERKAGLQRGT
ncbi:MAG TPA: glycoside hydrolase family 15 protein [Thermoanaerobaculia bacterium]|nr:glycoside hydrolase family 15 protein [Thermoanaerobaculia bacterium]